MDKPLFCGMIVNPLVVSSDIAGMHTNERLDILCALSTPLNILVSGVPTIQLLSKLRRWIKSTR